MKLLFWKDKTMRLNKYLSDAGVCSRREADRLTEAGEITVNGKCAETGMQVESGDVVVVKGKTVVPEEKKVYLAFNKPRGIVCTAEKREKNNVIDYLSYPVRIYPVGRLDKDSEGLLLMTNDGAIVNGIMRARNRHEKEYQVEVNKEITPEFLKKMASGVPILDTVTRPVPDPENGRAQLYDYSDARAEPSDPADVRSIRISCHKAETCADHEYSLERPENRGVPPFNGKRISRTEKADRGGKAMNETERMKELVKKLNEAAKAYYQEDREIMSNLEYDTLYDELQVLEEKTGVTLAGSPTTKVGYEAMDELPKEAHESPMLSLDKTKDVEVLRSFIGDHKTLLSWKMDGLTVVLTYRGGTLAKAVTRGNGVIGEVVTNNAKVFENIPLKIPYQGELVLRGEAIIRYSDFEKINEEIEDVDAKYKNPRNLCSGSVRQLNNEITAERHVHFMAFALVSAPGTGFRKFQNPSDGVAERAGLRGGGIQGCHQR